MSFSRTTPALLRGRALDASVRGVGMRLGSRAGTEPADVEVTLVSLVQHALPRDYRALGVLVAWFEAHAPRVNVPRLSRFVDEAARLPLERAWWAAVGAWLARGDGRWRAMARLYSGPTVDLDEPVITELQLSRVGADPRFEGSKLRVHARLLRSRPTDVDSPAQLAARHPLYRCRVLLGANYRADVWAALDEDPSATPATIARRVGCAYETARSVAQDWSLFRETGAR